MRFDSYHPAINFIFFTIAIGCTIWFHHPVFLAISYVCAFAYSIKLKGIKALILNLVLIPLALAGWARYLKGIKDDGTPFEPSPDPLLAEMQAIVAPLEVGKPDQDYSCLKKLYSRKDIFAVDLYEAGLGERIEGMVKELYAGPGAVRKTLHKYVLAR